MLKTIRHHLGVHIHHMKMQLSNRMAYRGDFFASMFAFLLWQLIAPVFVLSAYYNGASFPGWSVSQVLVLQGIVSLVTGISSVFLTGIHWHTRYLARQGNLDFLLIRPINTLWLLVMQSFNPDDMGQVVGGLVLITVGLWQIGGIAGSVTLFFLLFVMGIMFLFSLSLIISAITIKLVHTQRANEFLMTMGIVAKYPRSLYAKGMVLVFTVGFPLFAISHYPAAALLGIDISGVLYSCIAVVLFFIASLLLWHKMLKSYSSAGG